MSYEDEEEEQEQPEVIYVQEPNWEFSASEIFGIALYGVAGVLNSLAQAINMIGREFVAAGNFGRGKRRARREEAEARSEVAALRQMYEAGARIPEDGA